MRPICSLALEEWGGGRARRAQVGPPPSDPPHLSPTTCQSAGLSVFLCRFPRHLGAMIYIEQESLLEGIVVCL